MQLWEVERGEFFSVSFQISEMAQLFISSLYMLVTELIKQTNIVTISAVSLN